MTYGRHPWKRKVPHVQNRVAAAYEHGDRYADTGERVPVGAMPDPSRPVRSASLKEIAAECNTTVACVTSAWAQVKRKRGWLG